MSWDTSTPQLGLTLFSNLAWHCFPTWLDIVFQLGLTLFSNLAWHCFPTWLDIVFQLGLTMFSNLAWHCFPTWLANCSSQALKHEAQVEVVSDFNSKYSHREISLFLKGTDLLQLYLLCPVSSSQDPLACCSASEQTTQMDRHTHENKRTVEANMFKHCHPLYPSFRKLNSPASASFIALALASSSAVTQRPRSTSDEACMWNVCKPRYTRVHRCTYAHTYIQSEL